MGAGIALSFSKRFKDLKLSCIETIKEFNLTFPCVIYYNNERIIFNLVAKKRYYNKPTYNSLRTTLKELKELCDKNNIKYLAMPRIGCGLDKLEWEIVREYIKKEFEGTDIEIIVCTL
ncbi:macro domain-containing protein [Clostridium sp.]|uniref:macro domain-containing protein n=1 Tax=Clostridium sp. TaxID=1506 RepID=UPI001B74A21F|nr:macro domain-containing protein [Clostridium sp.]MBP3915465.1 macro domain-containing protein [Clostridium sp.]